MAKRRHHRSKASKRPEKPVLTVDTKTTQRALDEGPVLQSAPVGTRQEKGIPPLYQFVDRHCEKLAEMMQSPTWRSNNDGPHLAKPSATHMISVSSHDCRSPVPINAEEAIRDNHHSDEIPHDGRFSVRSASSPSSGTTLVDEIQLSRDIEAVRLVDLHPFLKTSEGTYILSAAVSCTGDSAPEAVYGDIRRVTAFQSHSIAQSDADEYAVPPERQDGQDLAINDRDGCSVASQSSRLSTDPFHPKVSPRSHNIEDDVGDLMKQDEAIQSVNNSLRPRNCQGRSVGSDEKQRFSDILQRLRRQRQARPSSDSPPLGDSAIIAFARKAIVSPNPTERSGRLRSDSGYASPSVSSRVSTRAFSRGRRTSSEATKSEPLIIQHSKGQSHDSGLDVSSKNSTLNPAAKEFSAGGDKGIPLVKPNVLIRSPMPDNLWLPPQKSVDLAASSPQFGVGSFLHAAQPSWPPVQAHSNTPLMHQVASGIRPSGLSPPFANLLPHPGDFPIGGMPTPPGLGMASPMTPFTGLPSAPCQPCMHGPGPGFITSCFRGPFQPLLSNLMTCNNPNHQGMPSFGSPALGSAPPAAMMAPGPMGNTPLHSAGPLNLGPAFVPKHVPKPKVPNTTGQQNWELMHELRRMNEPGYAQKCKEKQKKRYLKQLEKTGGSGTWDKNRPPAATDNDKEQSTAAECPAQCATNTAEKTIGSTQTATLEVV